MYRELISRPVPATKTGKAYSRQYSATPSVWNITAIYLVSLSGVADPLLTSKGLAMSLLSLGSAVGSGGINWRTRSEVREWMMTSFPVRKRWWHHFPLLGNELPESVHLTPTVVLINANFWPRVHIHIVHQLHLVPFTSSYKMWWTSLLR